MSQDNRTIAELLSLAASPKPEPQRVDTRALRLASKRRELSDLLRKVNERESEGLALYRALPHGLKFHKCRKLRVLALGANRSGKTEVCGVEFARAMCGCDPFDKYVRHNGNALCVGLDLDHIAMMWRKVAQPGAFHIIPDEHTGLLRSVRPDPNDPMHLDPYDEAYREKWREAPPFIPPRMIKQIAWEDRGKGIPRLVTFSTGWRSLWRSSDGKPSQGDHYNVVWFDEHISDINFYYESIRGLTPLGEPKKHLPRFIWSATSQATNPELLELDDLAHAGSEIVGSFLFLIDDNPYVSDEAKRAFWESLPEDEREVRYYGRHASFAQRVYPTYDPQGIHGCEPFEIPLDWARYVSVDPGRTHCGTVFAAVDPEQEHVWVYDAFDLRDADATKWAAKVAERERGVKFEAMVIDQQRGKQHHGDTNNIAEHYSEQLKAAGVVVRRPGPLAGFFHGLNDIFAREEALRAWMVPRSGGPFEGKPTLQVMRGTVPDEFHKQIRWAQRDRKQPDKRTDKGRCDILEALEYLAAFAPSYYKPEKSVPVKDERKTEDELVYERFQEKKRKRQHQSVF